MALTHDIDYLYRKPINRLKVLRNMVKTISLGKLSYTKWSDIFSFYFSFKEFDFDQLRNIEQNNNVSSTLNFSGYSKQKGDTFMQIALNPSYCIEDVGDKSMPSHAELGMHGSTKAFDNLERFQNEFNEVEKLGKCLGGRQHMLSFKFPESFKIMEKCGYVYDSSMGFNDYNGFRGCNAIPHWPTAQCPSEQSILELPLIFMDSVFTKQGIFDPDIILKDAEKLAEQAIKYSFTGALCWHDMSFFKNSSLALAYDRMIKLFKSKGGVLLPAGELANFHKCILGIRVLEVKGDVCSIVSDANQPENVSIFKKDSKGREVIGEILNKGEYSFNLGS